MNDFFFGSECVSFGSRVVGMCVCYYNLGLNVAV